MFVSVFFLQGAARYLFTPLAMAVVFAMLASYCLSRTLTPIMIGLLTARKRAAWGGDRLVRAVSYGIQCQVRPVSRFLWLAAWRHSRRPIVMSTNRVACRHRRRRAVAQCRLRLFSSVDAGLIQLHVRAPARTRIERTEQIFQAIEDNIRAHVQAKDLKLMIDNIGLPARVFNLAFTDGSAIEINDGVIQIELSEDHQPTAEITKKLRTELPVAFPDVLFYFQPADLVTQVLNFGVPTQIDVQVQGRDRENNAKVAALVQQKMAAVPGIVDAHVQQELGAPEMYYTVDRTRAQQLQLKMQDIANNLNISLSSSEQVSPNFWVDPKNGVPYYMAVQTPEYRIANKSELDNTPLDSGLDPVGTPIPTVLGNIATAQRVGVQSVYNHSNIQGVYDVYGSTQYKDLGSVASAVRKIVAEVEPQLKPGNHVAIRGQIDSMAHAFGNLTLGSCLPRCSSTC